MFIGKQRAVNLEVTCNIRLYHNTEHTSVESS